MSSRAREINKVRDTYEFLGKEVLSPEIAEALVRAMQHIQYLCAGFIKETRVPIFPNFKLKFPTEHDPSHWLEVSVSFAGYDEEFGFFVVDLDRLTNEGETLENLDSDRLMHAIQIAISTRF